MGLSFTAEVIIPGTLRAPALVSSEPISFWGGYDYESGEIIDRRHPLAGQNGAGKILAIPFTRGSSTTTAVLLEAIRAGTAPAAILSTSRDSFFALASIVADEMYQHPLPLLVIAEADLKRLPNGGLVEITAEGQIEVLEGD